MKTNPLPEPDFRVEVTVPPKTFEGPLTCRCDRDPDCDVLRGEVRAVMEERRKRRRWPEIRFPDDAPVAHQEARSATQAAKWGPDSTSASAKSLTDDSTNEGE